MDIQISYFELPICTDLDAGKVELVPWPFLLPSTLVTSPKYATGFCMLWGCDSWPEGFILGNEQGFLHLLVGDLGELDGYWQQLLLDFPRSVHTLDIVWRLLSAYAQHFTNRICFLLGAPIVVPNFANNNMNQGDEGNALRGSWMTFHFLPDLNPLLTNSACSRFLITTVPSSMYPVQTDGNTFFFEPWVSFQEPLVITSLRFCIFKKTYVW